MSALPRIVVVGAGGIGHPAATMLLRERVALRVIDDDRVEASNVHRLAEASEQDIGSLKIDVLRELARGRGEVDEFIADRVTPETAEKYLAGADVVLEGSDNFATKFLVADACGLLGIPSVHGAAVGWLGTVLSVLPGESACYRCVFEDLPVGDAVDCGTAGIYGPVTSVVGALMAADALRLARGERRFAGSIGSYDGLRNTFRSTALRRRADCALCGTRAIRALEADRYAAPLCAV